MPCHSNKYFKANQQIYSKYVSLKFIWKTKREREREKENKRDSVLVAAVPKEFGHKYSFFPLHDFDKIRSKKCSFENSALSYYLQHVSSKFMNPAFIGVKFPILMNGLDSIVINFPQVQLRQSVTSIKSLRQLAWRCHFFTLGLLKLTKTITPRTAWHPSRLWVVLLSSALLLAEPQILKAFFFKLYTNIIFLLWYHGDKIALCVLTYNNLLRQKSKFT